MHPWVAIYGRPASGFQGALCETEMQEWTCLIQLQQRANRQILPLSDKVVSWQLPADYEDGAVVCGDTEHLQPTQFGLKSDVPYQKVDLRSDHIQFGAAGSPARAVHLGGN
jgi:hypothetical protein